MPQSLIDPIQSLTVLTGVILFARYLKRHSKILQRYFIPSSLVAGVIGLLLSAQVSGIIPVSITSYWETLPKYLIVVVFAGIFLGRLIPSRREVWRLAGPQIAFGNTIAWGQYVIGLLLTILVLTPIFSVNPLAGALIEISFEGGHGTSAGLAPVFQQLGWTEGSDIALALATLSLVMAIILGVIFINQHNRRTKSQLDEEDFKKQRRQLIRSGYNLINFGRKIDTNPQSVLSTVLGFVVAIGFGWLMLQALIGLENLALNSLTGMRFFTHLPLFTFALVGGLLVQISLRKINQPRFVDRRVAEVISAVALDILVASAVGTISLRAIGNNLPTFIILGVAGIMWIVSAFWFLAPRMFPSHWFEKGITNMGQSMGMTATGFLLQRLADPNNHSRARESFAYKQLVFEPFMGGGIVTAMAIVFIYEFGPFIALIVSGVQLVFWLLLGLYLTKKYQSAEAE